MSNHHSIQDLPLVVLPDNYATSPGPFLAKMHDVHGPIFRSRDGNRQEIVHVVGPEANRMVMVTARQKLFHEQGWRRTQSAVEMFGKGLTFMDGDEHDLHRKLLSPAMTPKTLEETVLKINQLIQERLGSWNSQKSVDIYAEAHRLTFDVSAALLLGMTSASDRDRYRALYLRLFWLEIEAASRIAPALRSGWMTQQLTAIRAAMDDLFRPMIRQQRLKPEGHVFGRLCAANGSEALSDAAIIAEVNTLMLAGHITTSSLTAWLVYLLMRNPCYCERVLAEQDIAAGTSERVDADQLRQMAVLENALKEAERLYPPIADLPRAVMEVIEFHGYTLLPGTLIMCSIVGTHYLKSLFRRPQTFDPDRFAAPREEHLKTPYRAWLGLAGGRVCAWALAWRGSRSRHSFRLFYVNSKSLSRLTRMSSKFTIQ